MNWKKLGLGCGILLVLGFGGCVALVALSDPNGAETIDSAGDSTDPTESTATATAATIPVGTMTDVRQDRAIQIDSIEIVDSLSTGNEFIEPIEGGSGKLAVVYLQAKNSGNESGDLAFSSFELVDAKGRTYAEIQDFEEIVSVNIWAESQGLSDSKDQLFPGETVSIAKVFRVAPDAESFELVANGTKFQTR